MRPLRCLLALAPAAALAAQTKPIPVHPGLPVQPRAGGMSPRALFGLVARSDACDFGSGSCAYPTECCGTGCYGTGHTCCFTGAGTASDFVCPEGGSCCDGGCIPIIGFCCDNGTYCPTDECTCFDDATSSKAVPVGSSSLPYDGARGAAQPTATSSAGSSSGSSSSSSGSGVPGFGGGNSSPNTCNEAQAVLNGAANKGGGHGGGSSGSSGSSGDDGSSGGSSGSSSDPSSGGSCSSGSNVRVDMGLLHVLAAAVAFCYAG